MDCRQPPRQIPTQSEVKLTPEIIYLIVRLDNKSDHI